MKLIFIKFIRLFSGLFLFAVGIVMTINANIGIAPWDVLHQGLSRTINITMGQAGIAVGFIMVILNFLLKEKVGWGTISNMLFVGLFIDFLMINGLVPIFEGFLPSIVMMFLGMFVLGLATVLYIGACLGSGPRDGMMVALTKLTGKSVRLVRNSIELTVLLIGYLLGGFVGLGTLIFALFIGPIVQVVFKLLYFDVKEIKHRYIDEDLRYLIGRYISKSKREVEISESVDLIHQNEIGESAKG